MIATRCQQNKPSSHNTKNTDKAQIPLTFINDTNSQNFHLVDNSKVQAI